MHAAVVTSFEQPPAYAPFADPVAAAGELLVSLSAAAVSPLVRARASGRHYSSASPLPFVAGIDGVGVSGGRRVYFAFPRAPFGALGTLVPARADFCAPVPDDIDDATAAAIANPGMSSWAALTLRARIERGESVLINGATGTSGRLAIGIAKYLGARTVVATGRNPASLAELPALGADVVISLEDGSGGAERFRDAIHAHDVSVVLDYLWGASAEALIAAIGSGMPALGERRIRFVQVGAASGATLSLAGGMLRGSGLELLGSGIGSVSERALVHAVGELFTAVGPAGLRIATALRPLEEVATAWHEDVGERRIVLTV